MRSPLLQAAVIGLGVGERHIAGYEADPRCKVVALCDTDRAKLTEVGARHPGRRLSEDPAEILSDPNIGVVSIASYDDAHFDQVMAALRSGKHVFVEKPLCLHDRELVGIEEEVGRRPQLRLSSNLILRRSPRFQRLRENLREGRLGTPYYVEADYNYGRLHKVTEGWRGEIPYYSVVHGGAIHMIDLVMWLIGDRPVEVTAFGTRIATEGSQFKHDDCVAALLKFSGGAIAKVTSNYGCVFPHHHNLAVYGTAATFVHDLQGARIHDSRRQDAVPIVVEDAYMGPAKGDMIPTFVRSVLDGGEPEVSASEVFDAMRVSLAIERAARLNQKVTIPWGRGADVKAI